MEKNDAFRTEKNAVPNPAYSAHFLTLHFAGTMADGRSTSPPALTWDLELPSLCILEFLGELFGFVTWAAELITLYSSFAFQFFFQTFCDFQIVHDFSFCPPLLPAMTKRKPICLNSSLAVSQASDAWQLPRHKFF